MSQQTDEVKELIDPEPEKKEEKFDEDISLEEALSTLWNNLMNYG